MIEVHNEMSYKDAVAIFERHGLKWDSYDGEIATVLGGLDAEIAALQAQCEQYAALLIGERGENAKLRAENTRLQMAFARIASGSATNGYAAQPGTVEAENAKLRQQVAAVRQFLVDEEFLDENEVDGFMEALVTGEQHENND
jgi:hypothetical protein